MARRVAWLLFLAFLIGLGADGTIRAQAGAAVPAHPEKLTFGPLEFEVPDAKAYRHTLSNGIPVFIAEDHALPLVDLTITVRTGAFLDSADRPGVAQMAGQMIRDGGTARKSAEEFDEAVDFLASNISTFTGQTSGGASLNAITGALDGSLDLFFEMLKTPGFQQDRIDVAKDESLESMKQRNDHPARISGREWGWLMRGRDFFATQAMTAAQLEAITRDDLLGFHASYWRPENMIIAVSGDVDTKAILAKLEEHFDGWNPEGPKVPWPPKGPDHKPTPGIYYVDKEIPQGRVRIGHLTLQRKAWDTPEDYAAAVMNDILGGGGFTSRLTKRIRSDEGLAYSAGSSYGVGNYWPGEFRVGFQSKSPTVAYALEISLEEIERIQNGEVSEEELTTAKNSFIEVFPRTFESPDQIVNLFADDVYIGRPHSHWKKYQDLIRAVKVKDVEKAAKERLNPDNLVMLIVGNWEEISAGEERATMKQFAEGKATELPLLDPLTLEPLE